MDAHIIASLRENQLEESISLLVKGNKCTIEDIKRMKIAEVTRILVDDDLAERFDVWRRNYKEPRAPLFFERLNTDPTLHHLSVVVRVDMNDAAQPLISTVESVLVDHLMVASKGYVPMISLIGGTGSGKSFLTSSFMAERSESARWPTVAAYNQSVPTTSHVCIFEGNLRVGSKRSVNLLDLEGESGATPKTLVHNLAGMAQEAAASIVGSAVPSMTHFLRSTAANRGKIIKHTMPRMAYLLSDVVIFVDTIELRREEFKDRVKSFALEAHKSCNSVGWRPALILVSNRWSPPSADLLGVDQTSVYKDVTQDLLPLFSQVALMRIPCANTFQHNPEFVAQCIDKLHDKVNEFVSHVQQVRELHKCLYAEKKTWNLFREVVKWVHRDPFGDKPIKSLAELYENAEQRSSVGNCLYALRMYGDHLDDSTQYLRSVSKVLRWYAYLAACDRKVSEPGDAESIEQLHSTVLERCYAAEQCTATYTAPDGILYNCRQNCQGHEDNHSNPAVLRVPAQNLLFRLFGGTDAVPVRWAGRFQGAHKPNEHSKDFFRKQVEEFAALSGDVLLKAFFEFQPEDLASKAMDLDICGLCLTQHDENVTSLPSCRHILCDVCVDKRKQLYSTPVSPPVCVCPFCCVESPCPTFVPEEFVGFRVLSLDGGGVKGLIEVKVLQKIEAFFHPLKITNLFDVIVGTSAGGIIAMALRKNISLERIAAYLEYMTIHVLDVNGLLYTYRLVTNQPFCDVAALEDALKELLGSSSNFAHHHNQLQPPHIFCTAFDVLSESTVLLGSVRALSQVSTPEELEKSRVRSAKVWEAARATSATPAYFPSYELSRRDGSMQILFDGGVGANSPAHLAMGVAKVLQRSSSGSICKEGKIDMCLSLGTGEHVPNLAVQTANGLTSAGKFIRRNEKYVETPEFDSVKDRIRINPPKLGSLNAFASSSIPQIHSGMDDYFKSPDAVRQMDILFHTMYAKLWHVRQVSNPVVPTPYKFNVSLRDLRLDLDGLDDEELRDIVAKRGEVAPPADATHEQLVCAARAAVVRKPIVADLSGRFGCNFNGAEYHTNNGAFEIPTVGLLKDQLCVVDVYWQSESDLVTDTETPHRISLSGFPTAWLALAGYESYG